MPVNGSMLRLARQRKGFHQKDAAPLLGLEQPLLSRIENSLSQAGDELLPRASKVYDVPVSFFNLTDTIYGPPVSVHALWRKKADVTARELDGIVAELNMRAMHLRRLLDGIEVRTKADVPSLDIEDYEGADRIAAIVRAHWKIPSGPLKNLTLAAERAGIVVMLSSMAGAAVSGVTFSIPGLPPIILLNSDMPSDRRRFTLAHEIGHLVMHRFPSPTMEQEANDFASNLLMPSNDIRPAFIGRRIDLGFLGAMKQEWLVSMASVLMKAANLGFVNSGQQQYLWKQFSVLKIRTREPVQYDLPHEDPTIVQRMLQMHIDSLGYSDDDLASMLHVFQSDIRELYGVRLGGEKPRPKLTIIT